MERCHSCVLAKWEGKAHCLLDGSSCRDVGYPGSARKTGGGGRGCLDAKTALGVGLHHVGVPELLVIQSGRLRSK